MSRPTHLFADDFEIEPYWWQAFRPRPLERELPSRRTDVAIVGGGYAGLSAARTLAAAGLSANVFESGDFGSGASTRSGGALSAGLSIGKSLTGKTLSYSPEVVTMVLRWAREAFDFVFQICEEERIDCHLERRGRFLGACAPGHFAWLKQRFSKLAASGITDCRLVDREQQRHEIGSDYYHGGLVFEDAGKLHPALFFGGLLRACERTEGIGLCDHNSVQAIQRDGDGWLLQTKKGPFRARHVVVCTNGYTGKLTPRLRRRLIPVASHIIVTDVLDAALARQISPTGRTFSETRRISHYFRLTPDGKRLLFGGRSRFTDTPAELNARLLHADMVTRFPELAQVRISNVWQGNVAFTGDALPHAGELDGMHYVAGCNGSGVSMMPFLGHQVARKIAGHLDDDSAVGRIGLPTFPLYTGDPWFLPMVGNYFRARDFIDEKVL